MADTIIDHDAQIAAAFETLKAPGSSFGTSIGEAMKAVEVTAAPVKPTPTVEVEDPGPDAPESAPAPEPKKAETPKPKATEKPPEKPKSGFAPPDAEPAKPTTEDGLPPKGAIKGKHSSHWDQMRERLDKLQAERDELAAKVSTPAAPSDDEIKRLREERDAYSAQLKQVAFDLHPETRAQYEPQLRAAIETAKNAVGSENADRIAQLLAAPPSAANREAIKNIASNLDAFDQSTLASAVAQRDRVHNELSEKRANSEKELVSYRQRQQEQQRKKEEAQEAAIRADLEATRKQWSAAFPLFSEKPGDAAHNQAVAQANAEVEQIFRGGLPLKDLASAAHWAVVGKALAPQNKALLNENAELKKEIAALRKSEPGGGSPSGVPSAAAAEEEANMSFGDLVLKRMRQGT